MDSVCCETHTQYFNLKVRVLELNRWPGDSRPALIGQSPFPHPAPFPRAALPVPPSRGLTAGLWGYIGQEELCNVDVTCLKWKPMDFPANQSYTIYHWEPILTNWRLTREISCWWLLSMDQRTTHTRDYWGTKEKLSFWKIIRETSTQQCRHMKHL